MNQSRSAAISACKGQRVAHFAVDPKGHSRYSAFTPSGRFAVA